MYFRSVFVRSHVHSSLHCFLLSLILRGSFPYFCRSVIHLSHRSLRHSSLPSLYPRRTLMVEPARSRVERERGRVEKAHARGEDVAPPGDEREPEETADSSAAQQGVIWS